MEIEGEDGSVILLREGSKAVIGRGLGLDTNDRTVSRRHVVFQVESKTETQMEPMVFFQVIGRNPIWVRKGKEGGEIKVFRRLEGGELAVDDWFCVSSRSPAWFRLKNIGDGEEKRDLGSENGTTLGGDSGSIDVSQIDPVKEFGFLVIGHEFECYPKQKLRGVENWDWFLEEPERDSDEGEKIESKKKKSVGSRKRKKNGGGNDIDEDDDDWTGESEEDKETVAKIRKVERPKYLTRSRDRGKPGKAKATRSKKSSESRKGVGSDEQEVEEEEDDDDDGTLGGFIVDNEEGEMEQVEERDEEGEFTDDEEEE